MNMEESTNKTLETDMLLNGISIPLELLDRHGQFISANNAFLKLLRLPGIQKGKPCHKFMPCPLHCHHAMDETCILTEVLRTKKPVTHSTIIENRFFSIRANPIFDESGEIAFFVKSYTDISEQTERIQQENVMNRCLETFFLEPDLIDGMRKVSRDLCAYMDAERLFIMKFDLQKHTADHYFEYAADGSDFFHAVQNRGFSPDENWFRLFSGQNAVLVDDVNAPGAEKTLGSWTDFFQRSATRSIYVAPIFLDGVLWGDFGIAYDRKIMTRPELRVNVLRHAARLFGELLKREQMRRSVLDSLREARQANNAKSFFLASVSHELRTPLNAVIGFTELLQKDGIPENEKPECLNAISFSANALLDLVNDLLDLSKLESGELDILKSKTGFVPLAHSVMELFAHTAQDKGLSMRCSAEPMPTLLLDPARIRQVLLNLIGNAVKFTDSGSVELLASFANGILRFSVRDTGPGIPESDLRKLTEPFVQLSRMRGTNSSNHGTGLGLAVVKKLLAAMDGELSIQSEVGKGSTFTVLLRNVEVSDPSADTAPAPESAPSGSASMPPLLLVDDVEMNLKVLSAICRKAGFSDIKTASSGSEAFRLLETSRFGMILTDLWMPGMNGEELAKKIRSDERFSDLPLIAVTADMEAPEHFDMSLFNAIVHKPVTLDKIRALPL